MTPAEVRSALSRLDLSQVELARILRVSPQTVRRWVQPRDAPSHAPIPARAVAVLGWMAQPGRPEEWPRTEQDQTANGQNIGQNADGDDS